MFSFCNKRDLCSFCNTRTQFLQQTEAQLTLEHVRTLALRLALSTQAEPEGAGG